MRTKHEAREPVPRLTKDKWDKLDTLIRLGLFLLGAATPLFAYRYQDRMLVAQIQAEDRRREAERAMAIARLAAELVPTIVHGAGPDRRAAILILASVAPGQANLIVSALGDVDENGALRDLTERAVSRGMADEAMRRFHDAFERGLDYKRLSLDAQAFRELERAYEMAPAAVRSQIGNPSLAAARAAYAGGNFGLAADRMAEALSSASPQHPTGAQAGQDQKGDRS